MSAKAYEYPNPIHPRHGYATGAILADDVTIGRFVQRSKERLADRYEDKGLQSIYSFIMITDDCDTGTYFTRPEHRERYLGEAVIYRDLEKLAKLHLGGGPDDGVLAFNRMVAANLTAVLGLAQRGKRVLYLVPRYERPEVMKGYGHPSIPRAADIAGCVCTIVTSAEEVRRELDKGDVCLLGVCAYYRDILAESEFEEACKAARAQGVAILVDDASGARARVFDHGQRKALELGADVVATSTDKYGFHGPRSAFMVGRRDLVDRIRAVALMLGTEARPSLAAAICRTIAEFTPENAYQDNRVLAGLHDELYRKMLPVFGPRLKNMHEHGVRMAPEDFMELVMGKAGARKADVAPIDVTSAHATFALKQHGYIMLAGFSYPGGSREIWVHLNHARSRTISLDELARNLAAAVDQTAAIVGSRGRVEQVLFE
jgi:L-seryl-tRNA(Ser) seleniumtransferase